MVQRTEGIVLKTMPFGEADLIVTFLTRDHGIVKAFAKSPRKTKSRFGSSLEPLTHARISFWGKEDAALPRLTQADIIDSFHAIRSQLKCFLNVCEIVEMTLSFVPERDPGAKIYELLLGALRAVAPDCSGGLLLISCKLKLLERVGYMPRLHGCGRCGRKGDSFHLSHGTVLCDRCSRGFESSFSLSPAVVTLYANLLDWEFEKVHRIKPSKALVAELSMVIDEHVKYITERELKTKAFQTQSWQRGEVSSAAPELTSNGAQAASRVLCRSGLMNEEN